MFFCPSALLSCSELWLSHPPTLYCNQAKKVRFETGIGSSQRYLDHSLWMSCFLDKIKNHFKKENKNHRQQQHNNRERERKVRERRSK